jgi:hypothetical protein
VAEGILGSEQVQGQKGGGRGTTARSGDAARAWQRSGGDKEWHRYAPPLPFPPHKCAAPGDLTHGALCRPRRKTTTPTTSPMELHTGSGLPRSAMTTTSWIWSEVDAVVADVELFLDLAAAAVLGDNGKLGSDLGSGVFYYCKLIFALPANISSNTKDLIFCVGP